MTLNLYLSECITQCPANYYSTKSICEACDTGCTSCKTTSSNCQACKIGVKVLDGSTCVVSCPSIKFKNTNNTC